MFFRFEFVLGSILEPKTRLRSLIFETLSGYRKTGSKTISPGNRGVEPSGPLKWKMEDGKWEMEDGSVVFGVWCGVCGVWWCVMVCGNGSGSTDPVTPDVLGSTVADNNRMIIIR